MKVSSGTRGRLGNAIFRYLASALYCILYKAEKIQYNTSHIRISDTDLTDFITWKKQVESGYVPIISSKHTLYCKLYEAEKTQCNTGDITPCKYISDTDFITWKTQVESGHIPIISSIHYHFNDFYQHDSIYIKYLSELKEYIRSHPTEELHTDDGKVFNSIQLLQDPSARSYDTVIHIRLEDFITYGLVIHPLYYKELLLKYNITNVCIVMNRPSNELEHKYINYLKQSVDCTIETNDIITDYHIMQNAKTLICSNSTLSWAAALLSDVVTTVYMPNYPATRIHETFRIPKQNIITYDYKSCTKEELEIFLQA